ncbi:Glycosyltransferase, catalytic subunit of cellulose synthase and poly-beta-1,6-N-acetylglucosamine synthase [Marinitoga hydrogenitolerans DSM 16785]|uniref:Glycosyltransferase, catalytic subunit of cellulose synthase and poly-beta-1,6-N-acetylglucosamine synthase n=1 Tax=Marinitoga hydrogenitolerans (strain DSM 16785 / JCM 12826 / AT1271) TaxID=1122195 RepID=A0A1M4XLP0_MARH1|nr:glycosyltransferase family 2 protein [Marinitoga hydrogenitolerans]SHE94351.1 Glycosyltransferase, catalytic subunit of cellulose synthase and poly-beta-1,6-N-acetylglucosamine synthase [Marinitoga hydrogenitolerans DSM 16785]
MDILFFSIVFSMLFQLLGKYSNLYKTFLSKKNLKYHSDLKISIIIPTYNEEKVIEKSIECIQKNTYKNFEIIVIDDNSSDSTFKILNDLEKKYDNIKILLKKGYKGKSQSINEAFKYVTGDVVLFLDADTLIDEYFLEEHIKYFYNDKINMTYVDFEPYNYKEKIIFDYQEVYFEFSRNILYSNLFSKAVFMGNGVFIRKNILEKVLPLDNLTLVDDVHLALKLNHIKINQIFVISPKVKIQYVNSFRDLYLQHKRWYIGGIEELFKALKYKNINIFIINLIIISILTLPISFAFISLILPKIGFFLLKTFFGIVWGLNLGSALILIKKNKLYRTLINIFVTTPFMLFFEYIVLINSFFNLFKKEKKWYKVERETI